MVANVTALRLRRAGLQTRASFLCGPLPEGWRPTSRRPLATPRLATGVHASDASAGMCSFMSSNAVDRAASRGSDDSFIPVSTSAPHPGAVPLSRQRLTDAPQLPSSPPSVSHGSLSVHLAARRLPAHPCTWTTSRHAAVGRPRSKRASADAIPAAVTPITKRTPSLGIRIIVSTSARLRLRPTTCRVEKASVPCSLRRSLGPLLKLYFVIVPVTPYRPVMGHSLNRRIATALPARFAGAPCAGRCERRKLRTRCAQMTIREGGACRAL